MTRLAAPLLWVGADTVRLCGHPVAGPGLPFADPAALRTAVATLAGSASRWRGVQVVVSDAHCRYLSLPRAAGLQGRAELEASLAARVASVFGDPSGDWLLRHDGAALGERDLVCALRRELAEAVQAGLRDARRRLARLQPLWVRCSQRPPAPTRGRHWLATHDGHSLTLGLFHGRHCFAVRATRLGGATAGAVLAREIALQPAHSPGTPVWCYGGGAPARLDDGSPVLALPLPGALVAAMQGDALPPRRLEAVR